MSDLQILDALFRDAVTAIDAGDMAALERVLQEHPRLVRERLESPGAWLRDQVGDALEGFFARPYFLWFVAEDPMRNGALPANIAQVSRVIIERVETEAPDSLQEQLDYALRLICWSWIARDCGVQIALLDVLIGAGASVDGKTVYNGRFGTNVDAAIYNRNFDAAEHLLKRGASLTLSTALVLERWADADRLARAASVEEREDAFVQAAMSGKAEALRRMLALGVDPTTVSARNQSHATALHHAVSSGSLDAVRVLVEAGADLHRLDTIYHGTPLGWAEHCGQDQKEESSVKRYVEIAAYLRDRGGEPPVAQRSE